MSMITAFTASRFIIENNSVVADDVALIAQSSCEC